MATSKWRSSLGNVETRIRRSLGIAGPIDLALQDPPQLTPVIISDDATRPGANSSLRGRRWQVTVATGTMGVGNRGSIWLYSDAPYGNSGTVDPFAGGIIVDRMTACINTAGANVLMTMYAFPTDLVLSPGIPIAVVPNARFVDPQRSATEIAPVAGNSSAVVAASTGGGPQIARWRAFNGVNFQQNLEIFLNWNSALSIGPDAALVSAVDFEATFFGRIF